MFIFDRLDTLIDREPFIFIGWGGLIPQGIHITDLEFLFDSDFS